MTETKTARIELIGHDGAAVRKAADNIVRAAGRIGLDILRKPRWERIKTGKDGPLQYDVYGSEAEKKRLMALRRRLIRSLAEEGKPAYVPAPTSARDIRMKTLEVKGSVRAIIDLDALVPEGVYLRRLPVN